MIDKNKLNELSQKEFIRIIELEIKHNKLISQILRRPRDTYVETFTNSLGITLKEKRRWSKIFLGGPDVMRSVKCVSCNRDFEPRSMQHLYCDICGEKVNYGTCRVCTMVYEKTNPYEAPWEFDGFCSDNCRNYYTMEENAKKLYNWFNFFQIDSYLNTGLDDDYIINGIAKIDLPNHPWLVIKSWIETRDGNRCRNLGCENPYNFICVHHIDSDRTNNTAENLITLCRRCHAYVTLHIKNISYFFD